MLPFSPFAKIATPSLLRFTCCRLGCVGVKCVKAGVGEDRKKPYVGELSRTLAALEVCFGPTALLQETPSLGQIGCQRAYAEKTP